jgi:hypothetical protein
LERVKGFDYTIKGFEDLDKFSKGILALVNLKSNRRKVIADFRTYEGTWQVSVTTYYEMDDYLESYIGEIESKEEFEILEIDYQDFNRSAQKVAEELEIEKLFGHTIIYCED